MSERRHENGFSPIVIVFVLFLAFIGFFIFLVEIKSQNENSAQYQPTIGRNKKTNSISDNNSFTSLNLKNVGIRIDEYDPETSTAGDIKFDREVLNEKWVIGDRLFVEFGNSVEGPEGEKRLPEYTWHVPKDTYVLSPIDGYVDTISIIDWSQDYHIAIKNNKSSEWMVSFEHIVDLQVEEGEKVTAGQVIARVSPVDHEGSDYGFYELAVWKGGVTKVKVCPYRAFSDELKVEFEVHLNSLVKHWEEYVGHDVYNESDWVYPGCLVEELYEE